MARLRSLSGFLSGEALTLPYYRDAGLRAWVHRTCAEHEIEAGVLFSSPMVQYVSNLDQVRCLVDFVDVDSEKWAQYAKSRSWPMSWVYAREARRLLAFERASAARSVRSFFVTEKEAELFRRLAPECGSQVAVSGNGVDAEFFSPTHELERPFKDEGQTVVFTGAMDYWPNVDAVTWFAKQVLPRLLVTWPGLCFYIVGRSPTAEVLALAGSHVVVTGTVGDVRPFLSHADVVVAPLRLARGIQNKILEAMAMQKAVIAAASCAGVIDAIAGEDFLVAESPEEYHAQVDAMLRSPERAASIGASARRAVLSKYAWSAQLTGLDHYLPGGMVSSAGVR